MLHCRVTDSPSSVFATTIIVRDGACIIIAQDRTTAIDRIGRMMFRCPRLRSEPQRTAPMLCADAIKETWCPDMSSMQLSSVLSIVKLLSLMLQLFPISASFSRLGREKLFQRNIVPCVNADRQTRIHENTSFFPSNLKDDLFSWNHIFYKTVL